MDIIQTNTSFHNKMTNSEMDHLYHSVLFYLEQITFNTQKVIQYPLQKETEHLIKDVFMKVMLHLNHENKIRETLCLIYKYDHNLFVHSLNVTIYSLILTTANVKKSLNELLYIALGGLLHDIGKIFIPQKILLKPSKLSEEEFKIVQKHTLFGYQYLKQISGISESILILTVQHHEKLDGSGYPFQLTSENIHPYSKILAIADVFDALTIERPYKKAFSNKLALNIMSEDSEYKYDKKSFNSLKEIILNNSDIQTSFIHFTHLENEFQTNK